MDFLIEHQYVIVYFSGAFFSFFAMLSYLKINQGYIGKQQNLESPDEFFSDFDNEDLEALLKESFEEEDSSPQDFMPTNVVPLEVPFASSHLQIEVSEESSAHSMEEPSAEKD